MTLKTGVMNAENSILDSVISKNIIYKIKKHLNCNIENITVLTIFVQINAALLSIKPNLR